VKFSLCDACNWLSVTVNMVVVVVVVVAVVFVAMVMAVVVGMVVVEGSEMKHCRLQCPK